MSDDLISRRSILNKINEWSNKLSCENGKQFTLAEFEHIVANKPTAYDADKPLIGVIPIEHIKPRKTANERTVRI